MSDFFLHAMDVQYQPFEEGQEVPSMADIWQADVSGDLNSRSEPMRDIGSTEELPYEFASQGLSPQGLPDLESMTDTLSQLRQVFPEDHPDILRLDASTALFDRPVTVRDEGPGAGEEILDLAARGDASDRVLAVLREIRDRGTG